MQKSILSCLLWSSRLGVLHDRLANFLCETNIKGSDRGDPILDFALILRRDGSSYFSTTSDVVFKILLPFPFVVQYLLSSDGIFPLFFMKGV